MTRSADADAAEDVSGSRDKYAEDPLVPFAAGATLAPAVKVIARKAIWPVYVASASRRGVPPIISSSASAFVLRTAMM